MLVVLVVLVTVLLTVLAVEEEEEKEENVEEEVIETGARMSSEPNDGETPLNLSRRRLFI